ncbi:cytochrome d ubiquinol oxidase subunit II, partial [Acidobacteriota bacterium]
FWDGNEVWLLTGGGALFAAFPQAYATVFSGFYLALMLVLFSLIFRAVSLEFRAHDVKRKKLWEWAFIFGSFLPALLFGVALGNVIRGVPLNARMDFTGNFFTLLHPFALVIGFFGLTAFLLLGSTYVAMRIDGDIQGRARSLARIFCIEFLVLLVLSFILTLIYIPGSTARLWPWIFTVVVIVSMILLRPALKRKKDGKAFILSSTAFVGLWGIVGSIHFPNMVKASNDESLSLTISNASSSELTLLIMLIFALVGMPLVITYTIFLYRVFRGKIKVGDPGY